MATLAGTAAIGWCGTLYHPDFAHNQLVTCVAFDPLDQITVKGLRDLLAVLGAGVTVPQLSLALHMVPDQNSVVTPDSLRRAMGTS